MDQQLLMRQMAYRHDQMEFKANCEDYRKFQGADTVNEFVQAVKAITYDTQAQVEIQQYNPTRYGYMQLLDIQRAPPKRDATVMVHNRFDYLNDGMTLNSFERIRRQQLKDFIKNEDRQLLEISYKRLAAMHKGTMSKEEYRGVVLHEIN